MKAGTMTGTKGNIGFISTRLAGTDGVSLEAAKWAEILEREGFSCFYMGGGLDTLPERSFPVEEAHFTHPVIRRIHRQCFGVVTRKPSTTQKIQEMKGVLKKKIHTFIRKFKLDLLIVENVLSLPLNLPLALAITEIISETGFPTIAHHHDFYWERKNLLVNAVWDYIDMSFPPHLPSVRHVVINSSASNQLSLRSGISATMIPNVIDFETPPPAIDDYSSDVRQALSFVDDELFILQPTRVVMRKGIEHSIELVRRLGMKARLIISHASGDEGWEYERKLREYSSILGVDAVFVSDRIGARRCEDDKGKKVYGLWDIYPHADLVTYPSAFEGFGHAFLEAVYFRKPIVVNTYSIYTIDIKPKGFKVIELEGFVNEAVVRKTKRVLEDPDLCKKMVNHNYELGKKHYSYSVLTRKLMNLIFDCLGV